MIDLLDIRILKHMFKNLDDLYYLSDLFKVLKVSKSMLRLRLKKLSKMKLIKEFKAYPNYYIPNPSIEKKIKERMNTEIPILHLK